MKIPIIKLQIQKKKLVIEKRYSATNVIISLGCDCHPAYVLKKLNLRNQRMPFDWLNNSPIDGIRYVSDNLINNFNFYISDLELNERGHIVSNRYKFAEFIHETGLIGDNDAKRNVARRVNRFLNFIKTKTCDFLYNIPSWACNSKENITSFVKSVKEFMMLIKKNDRLYVYIRYDESFCENKEFCDKLLFDLRRLNNVYANKYIRYKEQFGIWGNEKEYYSLVKGLGFKLKLRFPRIYIS